MKQGLKGVTDATVFCKSMQKGGAKPMIRSMKSYAEGGMTASECAGKPKKPGCKKTFRSSGKSSSGGDASLIGKIAGAVGGVGAALGIGRYIKKNKD
jgi:hypothetical protein